ncbi:MAG: hypothetical protein H8D67_05280 [Deltaproteobacteria bacterium]|nr:hypothetical protein [Deltaproteobacteria bacterium]
MPEDWHSELQNAIEKMGEQFHPNELLTRLEQTETQLRQKQMKLQEWINKLAGTLKRATTIPAIDSLRGELNKREGDYARDEQLESILSDARSTLSQLSPNAVAQLHKVLGGEILEQEVD